MDSAVAIEFVIKRKKLELYISNTYNAVNWKSFYTGNETVCINRRQYRWLHMTWIHRLTSFREDIPESDFALRCQCFVDNFWPWSGTLLIRPKGYFWASPRLKAYTTCFSLIFKEYRVISLLETPELNNLLNLHDDLRLYNFES